MQKRGPKLTRAGGRRVGAGRPTLPDEQKSSVLITFRLREDQAALIDRLRQGKESRNKCVRRLLLAMLEEESGDQGAER